MGSLLLTIAACGDGAGGSPVVVSPQAPPPAASQANVNIDNPTLTLASNNAVSPGDQLALVWADEFEAEQLDPKKWFFESGDGSRYDNPGWGNNELQYYLPGNASVANGLLTIAVRAEETNGFNYTSARIHTRDRFAFRYGRIEARIRLPGGQGLWPAFWLLPQEKIYGDWAASGEIDIIEAVNLGGTGGNTVFGTIHYGGSVPGNVSSEETYPVPSSATAEFHTYAIEWDAAEIRWYVDSELFAMRNTWYSTEGDFPAPFDQHFYILLNVAVGGNFPGEPDSSTIFPAAMEVDWVRVYTGEP